MKKFRIIHEMSKRGNTMVKGIHHHLRVRGNLKVFSGLQP